MAPKIIIYRSGSVCLDVINQTWSPMYELINIFSIFLPQLLLYPNPKDPLNSEAARLLMNDEKAYHNKVKDYVLRYALSKENNKSVATETAAKPKS